MSLRIAPFDERADVVVPLTVQEHGQRSIAKPHLPSRTVPAEDRTVELGWCAVMSKDGSFLAIARRDSREANPPAIGKNQVAPGNPWVVVAIDPPLAGMHGSD